MRSAILLSLFVVAVVSVVGQRPGGLSDSLSPDEEINSLVDEIRTAVEEDLGRKFKEFRVISYKKQTVAGTNYFLKIKVGRGYIHVRAFKSLGGRISTVKIESGHQRFDPLEYF